jgi:hypothetical protein
MYRTDALVENNALKETLVQSLVLSLRDHSKNPGMLDDDLGEIWRKDRAILDDLCASNRVFLERLIDRQDRVFENLKRLFSPPPTYSNQGVAVEGKAEGCVVTGSY